MWLSWWAVRQISSLILGISLVYNGQVSITPADLTVDPLPLCVLGEFSDGITATPAAVLGQETIAVVVSATPPPLTVMPTLHITNGLSGQTTPSATQPPPATMLPTTEPITGTVTLNEAVNIYRTGHGLPGLNTRPDLCRAAEQRGQQITADFSHNGFEAAISGLTYEAAAENIWRGEPFSTEKAINGWNESPGHKANLLGNYTFGCGAVANGRAVYLFLR
jgi:uncharacterized protein YkwD